MIPHPAPALVLAALALAGCNTAPVPEKAVIVSQDDTEVVTPLGSHIRTRVLKGQKPIQASPSDSITGERLNDSLLSRDGAFPAVPVH